MQVASLVLGILSIIGMLIAFIPFFGWLNWLNIPFAVVGLIISIVATVTAKEKMGFGITGIVLCAVAVFFGAIRLVLGGGIF